MTDIKRYNLIIVSEAGYTSARVDEHRTGEYVKVHDHDKAIAEKDQFFQAEVQRTRDLSKRIAELELRLDQYTAPLADYSTAEKASNSAKAIDQITRRIKADAVGDFCLAWRKSRAIGFTEFSANYLDEIERGEV